MRTDTKLACYLATAAIIASGSLIAAEEPIQPIRPVQDINLTQVEMGKKLYLDPRLSKSGSSHAIPATT